VNIVTVTVRIRDCCGCSDYHTRACVLTKSAKDIIAISNMYAQIVSYVKDASGKYPLEYAEDMGHTKCAQILKKRFLEFSIKAAKKSIKDGAWEVLDLMFKDKAHLVSLGDRDGEDRTLLHYACMHKQPDCVRVLLKYGADTQAKGSRNHETPLHLAASTCVKCLKLLLDVQVSTSPASVTN
jgi:ankyrin repeat protein